MRAWDEDVERQERILQRHLRAWEKSPSPQAKAANESASARPATTSRPAASNSLSRWADSDDEEDDFSSRNRSKDIQKGQITDLQGELRGVRGENDEMRRECEAMRKQLEDATKKLEEREKGLFWEMDDGNGARNGPVLSAGRGQSRSPSASSAGDCSTPRTPGGTARSPHNVHASMHVVSADGIARKTPLASRHGRRMSVGTTGEITERMVQRDTSSQRVLQGFMDPEGEASYLHSTTFANDIIEICRQVQHIFEDEARVLDLQSPCYVFGDIHGNVEDLQFFQDNLWKLGMSLTGGTFLFLGDYVDRGQDGLEVAAYLFAQKLDLPRKLFMLRGNHETRAVNGDVCWYQKRSFLHQCRERFGNQMGTEVHEAVNCVFDRLPLAATIDADIFCVHGGIPRPVPGYDDELCAIDAVPCVFDPDASDHEILTQVVSDCIWSDPATKTQETQLDDSGFGMSLRGEDAVCFGQAAVDRFLEVNQLSYIFRAHTSLTEGIDLSKGARVFTIFSTSKDHGGGPEATCGCVLVDGGQIIVINRSPKYNFDKLQMDKKAERGYRPERRKFNDQHIAL